MERKVIIRFDDVCPTMNWRQFFRATELMDSYNIKPILGVIPDNMDNDQMIDEYNESFWSLMRSYQKKGWAIALHGLNHIYDQESPKTILCGRKHSEFAGNSYEDQLKKIQIGQEILKKNGIETSIFFAPAHSYDANTLKALRDAGFKYNIDSFSKWPYIQEGIECIPCATFGIPHKTKRPIIIAVIHTSEWDRKDKSYVYDQLSSFCKENKNNFISFKELANIKTRNYFFQKADEKIILFLQKSRTKIGNMIHRRK